MYFGVKNRNISNNKHKYLKILKSGTPTVFHLRSFIVRGKLVKVTQISKIRVNEIIGHFSSTRRNFNGEQSKLKQKYRGIISTCTLIGFKQKPSRNLPAISSKLKGPFPKELVEQRRQEKSNSRTGLYKRVGV